MHTLPAAVTPDPYRLVLFPILLSQGTLDTRSGVLSNRDIQSTPSKSMY